MRALLLSTWSKNGSVSPLRSFFAAFLIVLGLSASWAMASPLMSVPDEPSHFVKAAAVARGEFGGASAGNRNGATEVKVPTWVVEASRNTCYAFHAGTPANCSTSPITHSTTPAIGTTTAGAYNPVYYAIVGLPSLSLDGQLAVYAMRLVSAALSSLFIALMIACLVRLPRHRWTVAAAAVSVTPMVLYLCGSINPNSLEYATTGSFFASFILLLNTRSVGIERTLTLVVAVVSAALLANTRGLSLVWLFAAVLIAMLVSGWSEFTRLFARPSTWIALAAIAASSFFAAWWVLTQKSLQTPPYEGAGMDFWSASVVMLDRTFSYGLGLIGLFGWGDTPAPTVVYLAFGTALTVLTVAGLALSRGRARLGVIVSLGAFLGLPVVLQASIAHADGFIWQGRYALALLVIFTIATGIAIDSSAVSMRSAPLATSIQRWAVVLLAFSQVTAFMWTLRRYVIGIDVARGWTQMFTAASWNPPLGWPLWALSFAALTAAGAAIVWSTTRPRRPVLDSSP